MYNFKQIATDKGNLKEIKINMFYDHKYQKTKDLLIVCLKKKTKKQH